MGDLHWLVNLQQRRLRFAGRLWRVAPGGTGSKRQLRFADPPWATCTGWSTGSSGGFASLAACGGSHLVAPAASGSFASLAAFGGLHLAEPAYYCNLVVLLDGK